nr:hypothetical protein [Elizabethkingia sp. ASV34]
MNKINRSIIFNTVLVSIFLGLVSCRSTDNMNQKQGGSGQANVTVNLLGIQNETVETSYNDNEMASLVLSGEMVANFPQNTQIQIVPIDNDFSIIATLTLKSAIPKINKYTSLTASKKTTNLRVGVMYKVVVYNNDGNFVTEKNCITGQKPESISLNDGQNYTFIVFSINKPDNVPMIINKGTLNTAKLTDIRDDLMFFKKSLSVFANQPNNLDVILAHQFSQITTKLNTSAIGNISAISDVVIRPSASAADIQFNDSNNKSRITYKDKTTGSSVKFPPNLSTNIIISSPTTVYSAATKSGELNIGSLIINNITKNNIKFSGLRIMNGERYNLNLTLQRRDAQVTKCGGNIYWRNYENWFKIPYSGGNGGVFFGYSGKFTKGFTKPFNDVEDRTTYNVSIDRTVLNEGNGILTVNIGKVISGKNSQGGSGSLTFNIGSTRCTYWVTKSTTTPL